MKRSTKVAITATCLFLVVLIGGALYIYDRVDQILSAPNLGQLLAINGQDKLTTFNAPKAPENNLNIVKPESSNEQQVNAAQSNSKAESQNNNKQPKQSQSPDNAVPDDKAVNDKIAKTIQKEIDSPVDTSDMFKAGFILMSKLSTDEINFLFGLSNRSYTNEELKEVRKLLLSKLNNQDIETLRALAEKYGKNLYILDPNVPIE